MSNWLTRMEALEQQSAELREQCAKLQEQRAAESSRAAS